MDVLQQVVERYNLGEFFDNDIVDVSTRVIEGEVTTPATLSDFEILEEVCKNLPPSSSSSGVSSTTKEELNIPQLVQYSDSDTDNTDDESVSEILQNNANSIACVEISSSENEGARADKMVLNSLIQLPNISNNTSEDERKHDMQEEQIRKKKLTKKRSTPKRSKLVY